VEDADILGKNAQEKSVRKSLQSTSSLHFPTAFPSYLSAEQKNPVEMSGFPGKEKVPKFRCQWRFD